MASNELCLTNEQIQRMAAISLDALVGLNIDKDGNEGTWEAPVHVDWARIDQPTGIRERAVIYPDGSWMRDYHRTQG